MTTTTPVDRRTVLVDIDGPDPDDEVYLHLITVSAGSRGAGLGTAALQDLCAQADAGGWTVRLGATGDLGSDVRRLVRWYARHGFVPDRTRTAVAPEYVPMVRRPIA
jgi:GNAT superfamily N-acetyltransferase